MIDYKLLQEDINFPIIEDIYYHSYMWDSDNNIVAQFEEDSTEQEYQSILGDMKTFEDTEIGTKYNLDNGDFFRGDVFIGCVRGWGRLQQKDNAEKRQDNIAEYMLMCLNIK